MRVDYWGAKGYVGPPLKLLGGLPPPPPPPPSSYAYEFDAFSRFNGEGRLMNKWPVYTKFEIIIWGEHWQWKEDKYAYNVIIIRLSLSPIQAHDVVMTSCWRWCDEVMSHRRQYDVISASCARRDGKVC